MPDVEYVTVTFKVYEDAAFTSPSTAHGDTVDIFFKEEADPEVILKLDQIIALLSSIIGGVSVAGYAVTGEVKDPNQAVGSLEANQIDGIINENKLVGVVDEDEAVGSLRDSFLTGELSCK
jgi:hypothetical protein